MAKAKDGHGADATQGGANILRAATAEAVGTFLLVLVGTAVATAATLGKNTAGPAYDSLAIALSFGLVLVAIVAALAVWGAYGQQAYTKAHLGTPAPVHGSTELQGVLVEALIAFLLVFTVMAVATDKRAPAGIAPVSVGFALAAGMLLGGPVSGGAGNPARARADARLGDLPKRHHLHPGAARGGHRRSGALRPCRARGLDAQGGDRGLPAGTCTTRGLGTGGSTNDQDGAGHDDTGGRTVRAGRHLHGARRVD